MPHVESAHLVELALGNDVRRHEDGAALRHIASCERCSAELDRMTRVISVARGVEEPDLPVAPPERVWQRIAQALPEPADDSGAPLSPGRGPGPPAPRGASRRGGRHGGAAGRRRRLVPGLLGVAAVVWCWNRVRRGQKEAVETT
ncbi:hypothetical protein [Streptomyces sp. JJ38]|uniref:hypothetical protein n=1 Tax=Streptomyces sp. JJ38 TaxID=2738128 RepID=UPI001C584428|nr:hypothetical protein [Streptomyces sp. JJ38]MBW1596071.1 hypothetical protein [Streptomyces sp. JJ38]